MNRPAQVSSVYLSIVTLLSLILVGCGTSPYSGSTQYYQAGSAGSGSSTFPAESTTRSILLQQYQEWQGTPYRLGGNNRRGIDCSAFTQVTFQHRFNQSLPRTTEAQARQGIEVDLQTMQPGDLLFFNTDIKVRHVGIYMGQGEFLHASTSQGVTISRLNNPYWQSNFWQVRRVN